jgi:hypothetical protein
VPTSRRYDNPQNVFSQELSTMTEENENEERDPETDGGHPYPKEWQLDQESYKTEEDVEHQNYVLYEDQNTDDLCYSGGRTTEIMGIEISVEKLLQPLLRSYL